MSAVSITLWFKKLFKVGKWGVGKLVAFAKGSGVGVHTARARALGRFVINGFHSAAMSSDWAISCS